MYAIIIAQFNKEITDGLLQGAMKAFTRKTVKVFEVPGAWEVPFMANKLAQSGKYKAIVTLGAVIKGATSHDYWINHSIFPALQEIALKYMVPITLGIITCNNWKQAQLRSSNNKDNRGYCAALAAIQMTK